jgi:cytochrome c oxidase subunit 4
MMRLPLASIGVWIALLALMGATVATTVLLTTPLAYALNFALAVAMAALVLLDFMGLREADGLTRVFALAAFGWLIFLLVLTLADYLTRG